MTHSGKPDPDCNPLAFLQGGGEMGSLIRSMDWSKTSLGPVAEWPQSLRTTISICLASNLPICVIWGPGLVQLYNDAYRDIISNKHPRSMGQSFSDCFQDAWPVIGAAHDSALSGAPAFLERQQIFLQRRGYLEESFFTFSFSPIRDEAGRVGGLFHPVVEMTTQMLGERRTWTLRDLTAQTSKAQSVSEALALSAQALAAFKLDLPFVMLYELAPDSNQARLVGPSSLQTDSTDGPSTVNFGLMEEFPWPLAEVARAGAAMHLDDVQQRNLRLQQGPFPEPPQEALLLPIILPGTSRPVAIFVAGVSSRLKLNDAYRSFYDLLAAAIGTAVSNARAYDDERRRAKALTDLDQAKIAFFSNVSHEFRTPLTLMLGPVEDALASSDENSPGLQREHLEVVHRNGLRLQRLVNSLLDFSRIEAGRVRAAYEPTDLAEFTTDLASNFRSACDKAGLKLSVDCQELSEPVFIDRAMWETLILNLLSNAFKFTFQGQITVTLRQVDSTCELRVCDTGIGVPKDEISLLFERFHRVENARGRTHEGSGIGLALVQELVKLHGGAINIESELGKGTTFTVSIPLGSQHLPQDQLRDSGTAAHSSIGAYAFVEEALRWLPDADPESVRASVLPSLQDNFTGRAPLLNTADDNRPLVLIADDNADMRQYLARLLGAHYRIDAVSDGEAALAAVAMRIPDLILTDVMMPRLDGFGLIQALRAESRTSGAPIIMLSARAGEESRIEGMQKGADDYLVKPFSGPELLARVSAHLQMARMRRESNEALHASESRVRSILESITDGFFVLDTDWRFTYINTTGERILDRMPGDLIGKSLWVEFPGTVGSEFEEVYRRVFAIGVGESFSAYYPNFARWYELTVNPAPEGLTVFFRDITNSKRLEQENQQFKALVDASSDFIAVAGLDQRGVYLNRAGEELIGLEHGQIGSINVLDCFPESERDRILSLITGSDDGDHVIVDTHFKHLQTGRLIPVSWSFLKLRDTSGNVSRYATVTRDLTERNIAENLLRASEERRRLALDATELGTWHMQPATDAIQTDARFRAIFGTTDECIDYAQLLAIIHPDDLSAVQAAVVATTRTDSPAPYHIEYRVIHPDGSLHWVLDKGRLSIRDIETTTQIQSFDGTVADVTERKLGEQERERLVARLQDQDQRKDEFLATLAHELRNPLAPIRTALQIMRLKQGDAEAIERLRSMMERQLGQMVHLIDDLLDLSRISHGKIELRMGRIDLASAIQQAIESSRPLIAQSDHELLIKFPPSPIYVDADQTRLAQIFANLLNNAAKFTDRGGRIQVSMQMLETEAVISIQDNGIGIPTQMLPQVFEMFKQVDGNLDRSHGGLGIGLFIVKRLVEMHGGVIEALSAGQGRGCEFVVRLPVALPLAEEEQSDQTDPILPSSRHRIMIVDDNLDAAETLAMLLTMMGDETLMAHDGLAALDLAETFRPDVMFLDIGMPKLNGYEVSRRLRQQTWGKDIVLVAVTGWGQEEDKRRSLEAGFDFHLTKPVMPDAVEELLAGINVRPGISQLTE